MSPSVSPSLEHHPDLEQWIGIDPDGTVTVRTGKVELGQGLAAALARIAADELDVPLERVRVLTADTASSPDEGVTAGSMSLVHSGAAIRQAAAEARRRLLEAAAARLRAPADELSVDGGVVAAPDGAAVAYGELLSEVSLTGPVGDDAAPKEPGDLRLVGRPGVRPDLPGLVAGTSRFVQDLQLPGMLHARVARPPRPGARLVALDPEPVEELPGVVAVVRDGSFLAVVAEREEQAVQARELLLRHAEWEGGDPPPGSPLPGWLRSQPARSFLLVGGVPQDAPTEPPPPPADAAVTVEAAYSRPYLLHGSIGPSAAAALWSDGGLTVWCSSQGVFRLREALAAVLGLDAGRIRVVHVPGAGSYGHNGADDVALDAALAARAAGGGPVLLKWMRDDEHLWEPLGPAAVVELRASMDAGGRLADWVAQLWSQTHSGRPQAPPGPALLASRYLADPPPPVFPRPSLSPLGGIHRNAEPAYDLPRSHVVKHFVEAAHPRTSSLRSLGTFVNVFAIESMLDELADAAGLDPLDLRLAHLSDTRARDVLAAAAERAGWVSRSAEFGRGLGLAYARYKNTQCHAAVAVELTVDDETAAISLERIVVAADAGRVVDPDGLASQLEGGALQSASWTLLEEVEFEDDGSRCRDWDGYPILRFPGVPEVETVLLDRPGHDFIGAGEAAQGPTAAAIANAVFAATGLRVRHLPITPERLRAAAEAG